MSAPSATTRSRGLFVTGTDTGVGKTLVGCALGRLARHRGHQLIPFKPAETGCAPDPLDAFALWEAAQPPVSRDRICLYRLALPAAPSLAAAAEGVSVDLAAIQRRASELHAAGDGLLVEGAGGLLVPYNDAVTTADLARTLGLPLLLVARSALGTINHTALTLNEIARRRLPLAGLVLVDTTGQGNDPENNANEIKRLTGVAALGFLPHVGSRQPDFLARLLLDRLGEQNVDHLLKAALSGR